MTDFHALIDSYQNCACGLVGTLLLRVLPRIPALRSLMQPERLGEI